MGAPRLNTSARGQGVVGEASPGTEVAAQFRWYFSIAIYQARGGMAKQAVRRTGRALLAAPHAPAARGMCSPGSTLCWAPRASRRPSEASASMGAMATPRNRTAAPSGDRTVVLSDMDADPMSLSAVQPAEAEPFATVREPVAAESRQAAEDRRLARAQAGEMEAFRELIRAHQDAIYTLALRFLGVREDAQELAQDVFVALHRHLTAITSAAHLRFWLRRTVCHRAIDRLRRRGPLPSVPLEAAGELSAAAPDDDPLLRRFLLGLIAELAPMPRAVLLLRFQEDLDPAEIAEVLDVPVNTVKSHLKRSLTRLRGLWYARTPSRHAGVQS